MVDFARLLQGRRGHASEDFKVEADEPLLMPAEALALQRERLLDVLRAVRDRKPIHRIEVVRPPPVAPPRPPLVLSNDQEQAVDRVLRLLDDPNRRVVTLAGAAGTGKTTCVREILRRLSCPYVLAAPTGKAALRLRQVTGEPAVTLHRIAYQGATETEGGDLDFRKREAGSVQGGDLFNFRDGAFDPDDDEGEGAWGRRVAAALRGGGRAVVACDEASMVGARLFDDLMGPTGALGPRVKLLAIGDHCQLPPVGADAAFDLEHADAKLDKIHRQAEGGALLDLVTHLRTERTVLTPRIATRFGFVPEFLSAHELAQRAAVAIDFAGTEWVGLVSTNRQRIAVNRLARKGIGFPAMGAGPQVGEVVIALDNSYSVPCMNGEIGEVISVAGWEIDGIAGYTTQIDFGDRIGEVAVPAESWADEAPKTAGKVGIQIKQALKAVTWQGGRSGLDAGRVLRRMVGLAPAYSLTVHKSQGSEWTTGAFVLGRASWLEGDEWRLGYTAATRFRERPTFVVGCAS